MATTTYFDETIKDQDERCSMNVEFGRCSFYSGCDVKSGQGTDSIILKVNDECVIMDIQMAKKFVNAAADVGRYFGILDE
ncbi:hypothetical protein ROSMUCSMR3_03849 [Roseovarius mucosus]|uniref:Uncharacterized protein n=1 Tax=Roseovarius mucosus TaxID=215743 RepID=A0A1V0RU39_9RHOB|nr:hypothetical protein [Roseovarius mucosus]ARE85297.1 hypothetical protein ROSMUCSMR3_03849 [Roseovarius mucosus]